jgi:hypothetical protein
MCYSPEADLVAGIVVGAAGVYAIQNVDDRRNIGLAAIPLVLATHQLIEAVAWWSLEGRLPSAAGEFAIASYLVVALGIVPVLVPWAVMIAESDPRRRRLMRTFVALGVVVAAILAFGLATNPHHAEVAGRYIAYGTSTPGGALTVVLYAIATCGPLLMSSEHRLATFGKVNVGGFILLSLLLSNGLVSLWCVWAAVTSVVIVLHLREVSTKSTLSPTGFATSSGRSTRR